MSRRTLLFVSRHPPLPGYDGAAAYCLDLLSHLSRHGHTIHILWLKPDPAIRCRAFWEIPKTLRTLATLHVEGSVRLGPWLFFPETAYLGLKSRGLYFVKACLQAIGLWNKLRRAKSTPQSTAASTAAPQPPFLDEASWSALADTDERVLTQKLCARLHPRALFVNYCWLAPLLLHGPQGRRFILANDVSSQRLKPNKHLNPDPATPEGEASLLNLADFVLAISEEDASVFRSWKLRAKTLVTPMSASLPDRSGPGAPGRHLLFVGGINAFNREGLQWFLDEVWPRIRAVQADAELRVCGKIGDCFTHWPEGVHKLGQVPSLIEEYASARAVIVPLLQGSGIKIKLVEACAHAKACVSTSVGLQGLGFLEPAVQRADSAETFASKTLALLSDPDFASKQGEEAFKRAQEHLSPPAAYGPLTEQLNA